MSSPKIWGKSFWTTLHIAALGYPDNPAPDEMGAYRQFFENFGNILPCKKCMANYRQHLLQLPIAPSLKSRDSLFAWTVKLHNIVNNATGKAEWTNDYAKEFYLSGSYNDCRLSYDAQTLRTDVWRMILICMIIINIVIVIYCVLMITRS